ncbi:MAG: DUF2397 family protein, partial [Nocardiopsaceae bacterium]|nr:DUF2397 family protein [Nocardiopsaceae bacterium]
AAWEEEDLPATTPWQQAPPVRISPQLRRTGTYERRGQPGKVRDRAAERELLRQRAEEEAAQTAAARSRLRTTRPTRLSDLGELDPRSFRLFLALLGDALSARRPGDTEVSTMTSDGTLRVRLALAEGDRTAAIRTDHGVLTGPEHIIEITDLTA